MLYAPAQYNWFKRKQTLRTNKIIWSPKSSRIRVSKMKISGLRKIYLFYYFQYCLLQLSPSANSHTYLQLNLGTQTYSGATELTQYFVRGSSMKKANDNITVEVEVPIMPLLLCWMFFCEGDFGKKAVRKLHDNLHAYNSVEHHWTLYKLFQAFLLWSRRVCKLNGINL